jgi:hypothetical protein
MQRVHGDCRRRFGGLLSLSGSPQAQAKAGLELTLAHAPTESGGIESSSSALQSTSFLLRLR